MPDLEAPESPGSRPIAIVSGLPRSGTSMVMYMLAQGGFPIASDGVRQPDDDNPYGYFELERVRELDAPGDHSWLRDLRGRAVKVISHLLPCLPREAPYRVVFLTRAIDEVVRSQDKMLERRGRPSGAAPERTRSLLLRHLAEIQDWLRQQPNMQMLELSYRDVVRAPHEAARALARFVDAPLDVERMAAAVDPALHRNRCASGE